MKKKLLLLVSIITVATYAEQIKTFTAIEPVEYIVEQITKNVINNKSLIPKGQSPHSFSPTPKQLIALSKSNIYFSIDFPFERHLFEKIKNINPNLLIIDITQGVIRKGINEEHHHHSHEEKCNHAGLDPHIWLSPKNLIVISNNIEKILSDNDSANSAKYKQNLKELIEKLELLDKKIEKQLKPFTGKTIFVFHPSFGYFTSDYNLKQETVEVEGKSPTPRQLHHLIEEAKEDNVKIIFTQPQFDERSAKIIANKINGTVEAMNPLKKDIISNIADIANKIEKALK